MAESGRCVALLRAVNVGGRNRVPMDELRSAVRAMGYREVSTYVQSGNLVMSCDAVDLGSLAGALEALISERFGVDTMVMMRTHGELLAVLAANPFPDAAASPTTLHVAFLAVRPADDAVAALDPAGSPPDRLAVVGREVYLHYPNGSGRSKLTADYIERRLGVRATARNWNTVVKLEEMSR